MSEKKIIIIIALSLLVVFIALSWREKRFETGAYRSGWWSVSFNDPKDKGLAFTIDNETSKSQKFSWKAVSGDDTISEGSETVASMGKKAINPSFESMPNGKVVIEVSSGNDKKDIYKIFQ